VIPGGTLIQLTSSLIVVVDGPLVVQGTIAVNPAIAPGTRVDVVLVSLGANVLISPGAKVGGTQMPGPAAVSVTGAGGAPALAAGLAGTNGGYVKIVAARGAIDIQGEVRGFCGSTGGFAFANGAAVAGLGGLVMNGGEAVAVGGQAGAGGDVKLCAWEAINNTGRVRGGFGGYGGDATAAAVNGQDAYGRSAPSNTGGDVLIQGLQPNVQVFNAGFIEGGNVLGTGIARAQGGAGGVFTGGDATAIGGAGSNGGTVQFANCVVIPPVGAISAYVGGDGGWAYAIGGAGSVQGLLGLRGGDADATGGNGGAPGATPVIPTPAGARNGTIAGAGLGSDGHGGTATATGGPGGTVPPRPPFPAIGRGGSSGKASATGGTGQSGAAPAPAASPSVGPAGVAGGVCAPASSPGTA
jgi:hypothetical protein